MPICAEADAHQLLMNSQMGVSTENLERADLRVNPLVNLFHTVEVVVREVFHSRIPRSGRQKCCYQGRLLQKWRRYTNNENHPRLKKGERNSPEHSIGQSWSEGSNLALLPVNHFKQHPAGRPIVLRPGKHQCQQLPKETPSFFFQGKQNRLSERCTRREEQPP